MHRPVTTAPVGIADLDPFSTGFLTDPYPHHARLRDAAAAVWLERYQLWAIARHAEVHAALSDWESFCSGAGVGLADFRKEPPWRPPSLLLEADPPLHTRTRGIVMRILSRPAVQALQAGFQREAQRRVDALLEARRFDAVKDLAEPYPIQVFGDAVGITPEGRENLLPYGNMAFNAFGPRNALFEESMRAVAPVSDWIMRQCRREALDPNGFGAQVYAAADRGEATEAEAELLVRSLLTAGLDTTAHAIGNAVLCFVEHPGEWRTLVANPKLARAAFEEVLRYESPVQTFFRTTTRPVDVGGVRLESGQKVLCFLAAANRDPRRWVSADAFDISRNAAGHVAFGTGIHMCVHICLEIPPRYSVANTVGKLKGKSAIMIHQKYGRKRNFVGLHFWSRGYCVSTVGLDEAMIREYIRNQDERDQKEDQLRMGY